MWHAQRPLDGPLDVIVRDDTTLEEVLDGNARVQMRTIVGGNLHPRGVQPCPATLCAVAVARAGLVCQLDPVINPEEVVVLDAFVVGDQLVCEGKGWRVVRV